jgi:DnaK suppressor protein
VKAPATRTAKSTKTAPPAVKGRASQAKTKAVVVARPAPKTPARPVAKAAAKPAAKPMAKSAAKPAPVSKAPAKKAIPAKKPVVTKSTPVKPVPKVAPKTTAKAVPKAAVQPVKPVAKPAPKTPVKPVAKALPPVKPAAKAPAKAVTPSAPAAVPKPVATSPVSGARRQAAPAPIVVEPTPRPLGKRAAKKVMMEQMTQAAVVPTHAPDAAKATFFTMNERVMTPPVPSSIQKDPKRANNWKTLPLEQLTDQDVQAMPDGEYMNDVQMAFFRRKLSLLKADMLANAGETTEHLREDTVVVPDPADRATIEEEHALELRTRDRERKLLKKIEQAIARIDSGDYGYCEETGEAIGVGRLMARPTASLSLEAQQRRELKQKMFGD